MLSVDRLPSVTIGIIVAFSVESGAFMVTGALYDGSASYLSDPILVQNTRPCRRWGFEQRVGPCPGLRERYYLSNGWRLAQDGHQPVEPYLRNNVWFAFCAREGWRRDVPCHRRMSFFVRDAPKGQHEGLMGARGCVVIWGMGAKG